MSDAPRWPGADGGPGLDFSPNRAKGDPAEPKSPGSAPEDDTKVQKAVDTPGGSTDDDKAGADAKDTKDAKGVAPVPPRVAERAARTAKEWASMPVGPAFRGVAPGPASPANPGVPVAAATAVTGAAAATGATSVDKARSQANPVAVPAGERAATTAAAEESDPLPLDEVAEPKKDGEKKEARTLRRPRRTRKARLRLARLDPWSVMKTTFLFSIAFGIMFVVATFVLWSVLAGAGTLDYVNTLLNQLFGDQDTEFDVTQILTLRRILGFSSIVAAINVVLITALATLFAFLYNLAATVMGGLEVTLAED